MDKRKKYLVHELFAGVLVGLGGELGGGLKGFSTKSSSDRTDRNGEWGRGGEQSQRMEEEEVLDLPFWGFHTVRPLRAYPNWRITKHHVIAYFHDLLLPCNKDLVRVDSIV